MTRSQKAIRIAALIAEWGGLLVGVYVINASHDIVTTALAMLCGALTVGGSQVRRASRVEVRLGAPVGAMTEEERGRLIADVLRKTKAGR